MSLAVPPLLPACRLSKALIVSFIVRPDLFKSVVMLLENYVDEAATLEIANDTMDAVEDDAVTRYRRACWSCFL